MRGINKVFLTGNLCDDGTFNELRDGREVCSFKVASDRHNGRDTVTAYVRVNVYNENLTRICRKFVATGGYVAIEGELMNRSGRHEDVTEVRAREIVFLDQELGEGDDGSGEY